MADIESAKRIALGMVDLLTGAARAVVAKEGEDAELIFAFWLSQDLIAIVNEAAEADAEFNRVYQAALGAHCVFTSRSLPGGYVRLVRLRPPTDVSPPAPPIPIGHA